MASPNVQAEVLVFDGETYVGYVIQSASNTARQIVGTWDLARMDGQSTDSLVDQLEQVVGVPEIEHIPTLSGWVWHDPQNTDRGGRIQIRMRLPDHPNASKFFDFTPTQREGFPPGTLLEGHNIVVDGVTGSDTIRAYSALISNIETLNRDISGARERLRTLLTSSWRVTNAVLK